jgi:hypothetical protein
LVLAPAALSHLTRAWLTAAPPRTPEL